MDASRFFPYDTPYPDQIDAIHRAMSVAEEGGYFTMEAACGTGKTVSSLTAGVTLVREHDNLLQRVVAATPIKNQLAQFVSEIRTIKNNLSSSEAPIRGIALVGKADLHPYLRENTLDRLESHEELRDLRERAAALVEHGSDLTLRNESNIENKEYGEETWYDRDRAKLVKQLVTQQVETIQIRENSGSDTVRTETNSLVTGGVDTPYPDTPPLVEDVVADDPDELDDEHRGPFDPFFIGALAADHLPFSYSDARGHVITKSELLEGAASQGICPHIAMGHLAKDAEVVVCNYNHVFDYRTRLLTDKKLKLLNNGTLLVVDEAHDLEERARELFSGSLGQQTITRARNDLRGAIQLAAAGHIITLDADDPDHPPIAQLPPGEQRRREVALETLGRHDIDPEHLRVFRDALTEINTTFIDQTVESHLSESHENWVTNIRNGDPPTKSPEPIDLESPIDEPDDVDALTAALTEFLSDQCEDTEIDAEDIIESLPTIGSAVASIWEKIGERDEKIRYVTHFLDRWTQENSNIYYRDFELEYSPRGNSDEWTEWSDLYNASLELHNCIPADELAAILNELGGGIFMSATLEPHDVFQDVNGLDILHEEAGRQLETATYRMQFPEPNRASLIASLPRFTFKNRKEPTSDFHEMTPIRAMYARLLLGLAGTHGNILIGMPSYSEAEWVHDLLTSDGDIQKEILLDEPSKHEETQSLLDRFWADDDQYRILTTSLRGTITEGVDHAGNKLHTAVIVGVPLTNTNSPRMKAVEYAYADRYGDDHAFDYTFTIPAVRKARQATGRVIRSHTDVGVRLLVDERYSTRAYNPVHPYLSAQEKNEFTTVSNPVESINMFWETQAPHIS